MGLRVVLREVAERWQARRMLARMSPAVAEDFGIDWAAALAEAARPWWRPVDWPALAARARRRSDGSSNFRPSVDPLLRRLRTRS